MTRRFLCPAIALALACNGASEPPRLVLGTTHTVDDSGLLEALMTAYASERGEQERLSVIVAGTGEILTMARRGDIDVVLSHSPEDEIAFVREGGGESRAPVMHNDFVLLGPRADPAGADTAASIAEALLAIAGAQQPFVSRGDGSGTHRKERALWAAAQIEPDWEGYVEAGAGMADALRVAAQRRAYILADRATFEVLRGELQLDVVQEGDDTMLNQYSVIVVAVARNIDGARRFAEWIRGPAAQQLIADFGRDRTGRALYFADAQDTAAVR